MALNYAGRHLHLTVVLLPGEPLEQLEASLLRLPLCACESLPDLINTIHHLQQELVVVPALWLLVLTARDELSMGANTRASQLLLMLSAAEC